MPLRSVADPHQPISTAATLEERQALPQEVVPAYQSLQPLCRLFENDRLAHVALGQVGNHVGQVGEAVFENGAALLFLADVVPPPLLDGLLAAAGAHEGHAVVRVGACLGEDGGDLVMMMMMMICLLVGRRASHLVKGLLLMLLLMLLMMLLMMLRRVLERTGPLGLSPVHQGRGRRGVEAQAPPFRQGGIALRLDAAPADVVPEVVEGLEAQVAPGGGGVRILPRALSPSSPCVTRRREGAGQRRVIHVHGPRVAAAPWLGTLRHVVGKRRVMMVAHARPRGYLRRTLQLPVSCLESIQRRLVVASHAQRAGMREWQSSVRPEVDAPGEQDWFIFLEFSRAGRSKRRVVQCPMIQLIGVVIDLHLSCVRARWERDAYTVSACDAFATLQLVEREKEEQESKKETDRVEVVRTHAAMTLENRVGRRRSPDL